MYSNCCNIRCCTYMKLIDERVEVMLVRGLAVNLMMVCPDKVMLWRHPVRKIWNHLARWPIYWLPYGNEFTHNEDKCIYKFQWDLVQVVGKLMKTFTCLRYTQHAVLYPVSYVWTLPKAIIILAMAAKSFGAAGKCIETFIGTLRLENRTKHWPRSTRDWLRR